MAAWISNTETLFQIMQVFELEAIESALKIHLSLNGDHSYEDLTTQLNSLVSETNWQFYQSVGPIFSEAFHQAIQASQSAPLKIYTISSLELNRAKMPIFIPKQEAAISIGMPLIAFMKSITGRHDRVIDVWKGDLQEAGYQTQAYYDSLGMSEEWWDWIRDIAPKERMVRVNMLPYSPLQ